VSFFPPDWFRRLKVSRERRAAAARHREEMSAFYGRFVRPGDLCFDVGANLGNRTEILLALGARVICVEPQPLCVQKLKKRFGRNGRVVIVGAAVGEKEGAGELAVCEQEPTISTMSQRWQHEGRFAGQNEWTKTIPVAVTTLDCLIARYGRPVFCKIDVEGFEVPVLKGLSQPIPALSFEFTREFFADAKACIDHLLSLGTVQFNASIGESMALLMETWVRPEALYAKLEAEADPLLWGDIYVKMGKEK
jgi:FkbM family methyltransferase